MRRVTLGIAAAVVIAAGLGVHAFAPVSFVSDAVGDALYAVLIYLLAAIVLRRRAWIPALAWCIGVELFQLTGVPARWGAPWTLVFGSGFAWTDLVFYALGVALAAGVDAAWLRRIRRTARSGSVGEVDRARRSGR